ncbi:MAG: primosomal protein N', partial [Ignavibacteria bacterium CG_4_8_14_3_um_filter_37_9]
MYVEVVFPLPFRKAFTYTVPGEFEEQAQIGVRVVAPFGPRVLTGFIVSVLQETSVKEKLKDIYDVLDSVPIFDSTSIKFYEWLSEYYLSSLGEAFRLAIPPGTEVQSKKRISADINFARRLLEDGKTKSPIQKTLLKIFSENETISYYQLQKNAKRKNILSPLRTLEKMGVITIHDETEKAKVHSKTILSVKLLKSAEEVYELIPTIEKTSPKQVEVLLKLVSGQHEMPLQQLLTETKTSPASIKGLEKKEIITVVKKQIERTFQEPYSEDLIDFALTSDQNKVLDEVYPFLQNPSFKVFLLHGVTGSGKTQVYIELVKKVLELGKTVIILVPEIALTPQMTARLTNNFKGMVSVIHSKMSPGERFDSWQNILNEKSQVVIGARSALFSPLKNIGFIIVDEEHDGSYKQDETPRYNGKDAALMRAKFSGCPVLLGSATPSVESMYLAATKKYQLLNLPIRVDDAQLP